VFAPQAAFAKVRSVKASETETQGQQADIFSSLGHVSGVVALRRKCFDHAALKTARNAGLMFAGPQSLKMAKIVTFLRLFITPY